MPASECSCQIPHIPPFTHPTYLSLSSRKARRTLSVVDLRRAARKPWRNLNLKSIPAVLTVITTTAASSTPSANVPAASTISPSALLPSGIPPGLSISNASGPIVDKSGAANADASAAAAVSDSTAPVSSGGGGGGGATGSATMPKNGDLQVVILD